MNDAQWHTVRHCATIMLAVLYIEDTCSQHFSVRMRSKFQCSGVNSGKKHLSVSSDFGKLFKGQVGQCQTWTDISSENYSHQYGAQFGQTAHSFLKSLLTFRTNWRLHSLRLTVCRFPCNLDRSWHRGEKLIQLQSFWPGSRSSWESWRRKLALRPSQVRVQFYLIHLFHVSQYTTNIMFFTIYVPFNNTIFHVCHHYATLWKTGRI